MIVKGQVASNNIADPTTNHVIELTYVHGTIWQKNAGDLWSLKPTFGTLINPVQGMRRT